MGERVTGRCEGDAPVACHEVRPGLAADLLAHPYRRAVLRFRRWGDGPFHLADIAREVARQRSDVDGPPPRSVYVALYHTHAPKLAAAGVVSFDPAEKLVSFPGERADDE